MKKKTPSGIQIPITTKVLLTKLHGDRKIQKKYFQDFTFQEHLSPQQNIRAKRRSYKSFIRRLIVCISIFAILDVAIFLSIINNPWTIDKRIYLFLGKWKTYSFRWKYTFRQISSIHRNLLYRSCWKEDFGKSFCEFLKRVMSVMHSLQKLPEKLHSFFRFPAIKFTDMFFYLSSS